MVEWIVESPEVFQIKRVDGPKESGISLFALLESHNNITEMILKETDIEKAQKLSQIRKDLNKLIQQGL